MRISILTDDIVNKRGVIAEHGLSLYIQNEGVNILFDTGQSFVYCHNASALGIDLKKTDFIALSHGHYDHCGGLSHFPACDSFPKVYVHPKAFNKRLSTRHGGKYEEVGIPWRLEDHPAIKNSIIFNQNMLNPYPGIHLITEIPGTTDFEEIPGDLFTEESGAVVPDTFADEQMLVMETEKGLVCILGCSHPGVINCIKYVEKLFPGQPIYALLAGMHMEEADAHRIKMTIASMRDLGIHSVIPLHCTGIRAINEMKLSLGERCLVAGTGHVLDV